MYVVSAGATFTAGLLWALDLSTLEEMRYKFRKHAGIDQAWDSDAGEQELQEWVASVLARKELRMFGGKDFTDKVTGEFAREKEREVEASAKR